MISKPEARWLTRLMLTAIHERQIKEHGGSAGVRDEGLIESALARARNRYLYESDSDVASLAAAYAFGIAKNHGFVDGSKRTAFMAAYVFLGLNGWDLDASEPEVVLQMERLASGEVNESEWAAWLRTRIVRTPA